jgi:branched-chain amino acid aminotransferase
MSTFDDSVKPTAVSAIERLTRDTRVFISMPCLAGITPHSLLKMGNRETDTIGDSCERCYGLFKPDEVGLVTFDHGVLYGDAVFEGVRICNSQLFLWRQHIERLYQSARRLQIQVPYTPHQLTLHLLRAVQELSALGQQPSYIRLVITRGIGDLGINPVKCIGSTVYAIISAIELYPEQLYDKGIPLSVAKRTRRAGADILDPQIKSCNYLNNIQALIESQEAQSNETLMLTMEGFVAEATTDNLFMVSRQSGWDTEPSKVILSTPVAEYCLKGITRDRVLAYALELGFAVKETDAMRADELLGENKEVFLTGTAAGIVPVISVDGKKIGDGRPGEITKMLRSRLELDMINPQLGLCVYATAEEAKQYLADSGSEAAALKQEKRFGRANLIERLFEIVDSREWDKLREVFCDDIIYERPGYSPLEGFERVRHFYCNERVIASGTHYIERTVGTREVAACCGRFIGRHKNGTEIDERFADVYTLRDGRIHTRKSYFFRPAV